MGSDVRKMVEAWDLWDMVCADDRVAYLSEPEAIEPEFRRRNSGSIASGSERYATLSSAQTLSHRSQASTIFLTSLPITVADVRRRSAVNCVNRQKKNFSSGDFSSQSRALSE